ncbi:MAG TPA: hypothetical protein VGS03_01100, partial [Candidatus Polarisedimenticolia bacterium]|nr:hypothetical protein [Candidatus Polarisedimenticolia bacterium]
MIARPAVVSFRTAALLAASIAAVPTFGGRATADAPGFTAPVGIQPVLDQVDQDRMRADLKFLSDDLFEGRGTGQRGGELAARYLETRFR